jgi:1-acyl-sn-glycerol-3-phosphate acyltransferase
VDLYDAVAYGMLVYSRAAFRVEVVASPTARLPRGTVIATTHRRESDVPVICPPLYLLGDMRRNRPARMHFAARDDMFLPGFFAGFPEGLPQRVRRLLYPVGVARWLPVVNVHPIRSATVARLGEVLAARASDRLEELVPAETVAVLRARAAALGLPPPILARDALAGDYADLLWSAVAPGEGVREGLDAFWSARATQAARDFRALVELLRAPTTLVLFPEGRPSPDGEIGPVRPGVGALLRRGRPLSVQPLGLAYDPLVRGRTRVVLGLPDPVAPPTGKDAEATLLGLLRRAVPLTAGQVVAHLLSAGAEANPAALDRELAGAVEEARAEGRPVEAALLSPETRRRRLFEALSVAPAKPESLPYLARERESARAHS